jgi:hypothetical protein
VRIAKIIEQAIKMRKIGGPTMDSRTRMTDESEDDFQLGNLSCVKSRCNINYLIVIVKD